MGDPTDKAPPWCFHGIRNNDIRHACLRCGVHADAPCAPDMAAFFEQADEATRLQKEHDRKGDVINAVRRVVDAHGWREDSPTHRELFDDITRALAGEP